MFAVWITGRPASGKTTIAGALVRRLHRLGLEPEVLESDVFRTFLTPRPTFGEEERVAFYRAMAHVGELLTRHGVPVIFDATANRRAYRDLARRKIPRFIEVFVDCPLDLCVARDPKGLYRKAQAGGTTTLPGVQVDYEAPERPDVHVHSDREDPDAAAGRIVDLLEQIGYVAPPRRRRL
ncbi:MAG: adenylyl-sulfate kinase [Planctomycetes bacterium]|nr:adenylyl-sulfate kinase [Planctomycetota bacterium]